MIAVGLADKALEQKPRHKNHVRHVRAALAAAALHRVAEDVDQKLGIFFLPVEAVCQHAHELLLLCVQQHRVHDAATDDIRHERARFSSESSAIKIFFDSRALSYCVFLFSRASCS